MVEAFHRGLFELDALVSPPDMLLLEGARLVLRPSTLVGGGLDKNGKRFDSRFFLSLASSCGPGDETAETLFPIGLNGLLGGGLGGPPLVSLLEIVEDV